MPEGDTIAWPANRIRPVLEGRVPDEIRTPQPRHGRDRWPERLGERVLTRVDTHGKHLFLRFDGGLDAPLASADDRFVGGVPPGPEVGSLAAAGLARPACR